MTNAAPVSDSLGARGADGDPAWPYEPDPELETSAPSWECPEGICECHVASDDEPRNDHVLVLYDPRGKRMPGARVRVFERGRLVTGEPATANGAGEVTVQIRSSTSTLHVEWAPSSLPRHPFMPYRRRYHVRLGPDRGMATDRRLWNLGFGQGRRREDNIRQYQRAYGELQTGRLRDVQLEVAARHDDGELPVFSPQAPPSGSPHAMPGASSLMPAAFRPGPQDASSFTESRSDSSQAQPPSSAAPKSGGQNPQGALVASAGHLWLMIGLEPTRGPLELADMTVRLSRLPGPGQAACEHGPLIHPAEPGIMYQYGAETFALFAFPDLPLGSYTAMAYIDQGWRAREKSYDSHANSSRGYALGSTQFEVQMGLLTLAYIGATADWPILSVADPLLDLDVDVMQRRRRVLATIHYRFPVSVDLHAKENDVRPPYDQGEYGPMYVSGAGQNNCAPWNVFIMHDATGRYGRPGKGAIYGFALDQNPGFVTWVEGRAPSVGDCYCLDDGAGHKEHCGIVVQSSPASEEVWLVADGGQPDRTTKFMVGPKGWRRYYNDPYTNSSEAAYILPRLFGRRSSAGTLGNLYLCPGETLPGSYVLPGWADITHPDVPFATPTYDRERSEEGFRKLRKLVLDIGVRVTEDRARCAAEERAAKAGPAPGQASV